MLPFIRFNYSNGDVLTDSMWVDYGTEFIEQKEIQKVPFIDGTPAYRINIYNTWSGLSQSICAPTLTPTGAVPNCEITATTPNTQFFAESTNYQYILWSISSVQAPLGGDPLTNESAVTFTQQGIIDWTPGWYGQFNLNATAVGCDGILTNTSTKAITIQSRTATPTDIFIKGGSDLPGCPGGRSTTEFDSDPGAGNSVTWEIDTNAAGVINCDTGITSLYEGTIPKMGILSVYFSMSEILDTVLCNKYCKVTISKPINKPIPVKIR